MQMIYFIPAPAASKIASAANAGGTKITDVFAGQYIFQVYEFLWPFFHGPRVFYRLSANLPEKPFAVRTVLQVQITQIKQGLKFFPMLQRVMIILAEIFGMDVLEEIHHFPHDFRINL